MNINQLQPAYMLARTLGVKCLVYGDPGTGKTPLVNTAPRAVLCACEPGLRSMASSHVPTWEAYTVERMQEFFDWLFGSREAQAFDTVAVDSLTQYAELVLASELGKHRDPRKAYGELSKTFMKNVAGLYFMPNKHMYLIAKKGLWEEGSTKKGRPIFPGQDLNVRVPHLFDEILHLERAVQPQTGRMVPVFRTQDNGMVLARDRSGALAELEAPDLNNLFAKCMQYQQ